MLSISSTIACSALASLATALPTYETQSIEWQACPFELFRDQKAMQCGYLDVPMDWNEPTAAPKVTLGIGRLAARNPEKRIGNIFFNPGGPGGQPTSILPGVEIHPEIRDHFDIIGVDLRGTGLSQPVNCSAEIFKLIMEQEEYLDDQQSYDHLLDLNQAFRQSCIDASGPIVDYMDTISIAKDHEAVRQALGDEKLTWLGQSYGTQLGTQYAELFPDNIRAMVLDAPFSLSQSVTSIFVESAAATDASLRYFFDWCETQNATICPAAHRNDQTITEIWTDLLERARTSPILCQEDNCVSRNVTSITSSLIRIVALGYLFSPNDYFPQLAFAIDQAAFHDNITSFVPDLPTGDDLAYSSSSSYARVIVAALDWSPVARSSPTDMRFKALLADSETPLFNGTSASWTYFLKGSLGWPLSTRNPPHRINIPQDSEMPTVLMVSNLYDPATPTAMSHHLHEEIGWDRSVMTQTVRGGHCIYLDAGAYDGETVAAINRYLLGLELPEQGTVFYS